MDHYVLSCGSGNVTCRGFGLLTQTTITFNSRVYCDSPSLGEHLLRCGIDTSNIYVFTSQYNHTKRFTCGEHLLRCGIDTSIYIVIIIINTLQSNKLSRTTAHPRIRATAQPRNRATAQHPQGLGNPPNNLLRLLETPYTTLLVFPARCYTLWLLSYPEWAGIPNTRKGLTLIRLYKLVQLS